MILVGNGGDACSGSDELVWSTTVSAVTAANQNSIPIDAFLTSQQSDQALLTYFGIANASGGVFVQGYGDPFMRGDANRDGLVDVADVVTIVLQFDTFPSGFPVCAAARDVDSDGVVDPIVDGVALLGYLFTGATALQWPAPPICGQTPATTPLPCLGPTCP